MIRQFELVFGLATSMRFPPWRRLRKRRQFLAVQGRGRRMGGKHFLFFVQRRENSDPSSVAGETRFGITVTRKVGNAVTRNRVKRIVREGCRRTAAFFPPGMDLVVVARPTAVGARAVDAVAELGDLARRLSSRNGR